MKLHKMKMNILEFFSDGFNVAVSIVVATTLILVAVFSTLEVLLTLLLGFGLLITIMLVLMGFVYLCDWIASECRHYHHKQLPPPNRFEDD